MQQEIPARSARTNLAPIPFESDASFLKVTGELPRELNGTLRSAHAIAERYGLFTLIVLGESVTVTVTGFGIGGGWDVRLLAVLGFVLIQRRGLFRKEYEGHTLREYLGLPRPENRFFAAKHRAAE